MLALFSNGISRASVIVRVASFQEGKQMAWKRHLHALGVWSDIGRLDGLRFHYAPFDDSIIFSTTWSRLKLADFCLGGNSLNVPRNSATRAWAGTSR
jgi:hypothetical protein